MALRASGIALVAATLGATAFGIVEGHAGAFSLREQSAVGQGASFAGVGTPGMGLSAMFWNPAAVTQTDGLWSESHGALILPSTEMSAQPATSPFLLGLGAGAGNTGMVGFLPASYGAYKVNANLFLGYSLNAPYGLGTRFLLPWAGQQLATRGEVRSIDFAPIIGWRINDWISVGAGPRVVYLQARFARSLFPSAAFPNPSSMRIDDFGFGFAAGVTLTPTPWTEVALGYRSAVDFTLEGTVAFPVVPAPLLPLLGPLAFVSGQTFGVGGGKVTTPDQASLGIRQRVSEQFTLLGTVEWTNWSKVQTVPFNFTSGPAAGLPVTVLTFNYRDGWFFSLGGEYEVTPRHTIRAGVGYEISPITDAVRDTILPDNNRWWFSAGLSSKLTSQVTIDFGYSFVWVGDTSVRVVPGHPDFDTIAPFSLVASTRPYVHILAGSLRIKWGSEPRRPLVTKG